MGPIGYGLFLGVAIQLCLRAAPQPAGSIILWSGLALQLACGAIVVWRRTSLPLATTAFSVASLGCGFLALLAALNRPYPSLPAPAWWIFGVTVVIPASLSFVESRRHKPEYDAWKAHVETSHAWDIFTLRHIPDLNQRRRENARASS